MAVPGCVVQTPLKYYKASVWNIWTREDLGYHTERLMANSEQRSDDQNADRNADSKRYLQEISGEKDNSGFRVHVLESMYVTFL